MPTATVFVRRVTTNLRSRLGDEEATDEHVSSLVFGKSENDRSVYEANDDLVEVDIATALLLTEGGNKAADRLSLRLHPQEVLDAELGPVNSPGGTGVPAVDELHLDLFGTTEAVERLVGSVREGYRRGEDRVRRIDAQQILHCATRLLKTKHMSAKARGACQEVVQRGCT